MDQVVACVAHCKALVTPLFQTDPKVSEFPPPNFRVTAFKDGVGLLADINRVVSLSVSTNIRKGLVFFESFCIHYNYYVCR